MAVNSITTGHTLTLTWRPMNRNNLIIAAAAALAISNERQPGATVHRTRGLNNARLTPVPRAVCFKANRNDKCPCGSGLKFKRCCINKDISKDYVTGTV